MREPCSCSAVLWLCCVPSPVKSRCWTKTLTNKLSHLPSCLPCTDQRGLTSESTGTGDADTAEVQEVLVVALEELVALEEQQEGLAGE